MNAASFRHEAEEGGVLWYSMVLGTNREKSFLLSGSTILLPVSNLNYPREQVHAFVIRLVLGRTQMVSHLYIYTTFTFHLHSFYTPLVRFTY